MKADHNAIHQTGKKLSGDHRRKISEIKKREYLHRKIDQKTGRFV